MANTNTKATEQILITLGNLTRYDEKIKTKMATDDAATLAAAKAYADGLADNYDAAGTAEAKVNELANGTVKTNTDAIAKLNGDDTVEGSVDKKIKEASTTLKNEISASAYDDTELKGRVSANETAIVTLTGEGEGSVKKIAADEVAKIVGNADESMDTLEEVSNWISSHTDSAAAMNTKILKNEEAINVLNGTGEGSVKKTVADEVTRITADSDASLETLKNMSAWLEEHPENAAKMNALIMANKESINTLNGTGEGSVIKTVTDELAKIISDPDVSLDVLKEISAWIAAHPDDASAMNLQIATNKEDIAKLKELVANLPEDSDATNLIDFITKSIDSAKEELTTDIATAKTEAIAEAGTNTDTKITAKVGDIGEGTVKDYVDTAKTEAITDAGTKADEALENAKAYTDELAERVKILEENPTYTEATDDDIDALFPTLGE